MYILETPRLILRPPSHRDELLLHGLLSDPFVIEAVGDGVYPTLEQSKAKLLEFIKHWQDNRFGLWMVFVKDKSEARRFAGYCGLKRFGTDMPAGQNNVQIETVLHLGASGEGIGTEAGKAALRFAFENLKLEKVAGFIRPTNTRSLRKNRKLGFYHVRDIIYNSNMPRKYFEVTAVTAILAGELRVLPYTDQK
ncbi:GNAT family N-acetyltransferase [Mesorhizobium sp. Cs1321R2N1]|uniref:GNAT family N-acetyltransferase n=1 Tax=Mesorhizobium sp. Cs1321R2N1 TaxID=3015174 RepID=UPI00301D9043